MQRSNHGNGDQSMNSSAPLATAANTGQYLPSPTLLPGQTQAPHTTARAWPTLPELVNALKRRLVLAAFLGILVGMAGAAAIWLAMPNGRHRASAMLQVKPLSLIGNSIDQNIEAEFESFKKNQQELIRGRILLGRVLANPNIAKLSDVRTADDPVRWFSESIKVDWRSPELMEASIRGDDPKQLQALLGALVTEFERDSVAEELIKRKVRREHLEKSLAEIEKQIESHEKRLKKAAQLGTGTSAEMNVELLKFENSELSRIRSDKKAKENEIAKLDIEQMQHNKKLEMLEKQEVSYEDLEKFSAKNEEVIFLSAEKAEQEIVLERISKTFLPGTQTELAQKAKIADIERKLKEKLESLRPGLEKEIRLLNRRIVDSQVSLNRQQHEFLKNFLVVIDKDELATMAKIKSLQADGLNTTVDVNSLKPWMEQRALYHAKLLELDAADNSEKRIKIRDDAHVILNQSFNQKVMLSVAAFLAGCLFVMTAVAYLEWRSRRIDSVDQVINDLGLRVIGTIPAFPSKQALKNGDAAQSQNWRFVLNESVNSARTMLLHTAKTQNMQVLMVTSAMQGEGKTSLASQLATSMATAGLRTLILDCDLRNPSMHKLFDAPLTPGCAEVLCQEIDVSDAVQPTTVPNLWLIAAGQCSNRVITALAQGHPLETLFNRLRGQFDFIVVDSCPVLPVADSLLVGQYVDGVVLSILQDISQLPKVMTTAEKLTQLNIPLLGAVVNGIKPDIHAYGYNYVKQLPA